ncbi:MAG: hypothetical protein ACI959_001113 [Limisphaerales bacterium]|jgi:hypothetical protein
MALLIFASSHVFGQLAPFNNTPCNAISITNCITSSNTGAHNDPGLVSVPVCISTNNTVYFRYTLPDNHTNFVSTLIPTGAQKFTLSYLRDDCPLETYSTFSASAVCAVFEGDTLSTSMASGCLPVGADILIRVSSPTQGGFELCVSPVAPNCADECMNGNESGIDSLAPPLISISSGFDRICSEDTIKLTVEDPDSIYSSISWSSGDIGPCLTVTDIGIYTAYVTDINGCISFNTKIIRADTSCVWPGETNLDGLVNGRDLIPIGYAFNTTGPIRAIGILPIDDFVGLPATTWSDALSVPRSLPGVFEGINYKHVDANGDGTINQNDVNPIIDFYGGNVFYKMAPPGESSGPGDPPLYFSFDEDSIEVGDTLKYSINLGTPLNPAENVYSWWLTIGYDAHLIDTGFFEINFENSWLKDTTAEINFHHHQPGLIDISFSRTDQNGITGSGPIVEMEVIIIDNLGGRLEKMDVVNFDWLAAEVFDDTLGFIATDVFSDSVQIWEFCASRGLNSSAGWIRGVNISGKRFVTDDNHGYLFTDITSKTASPGQAMYTAGLGDFPGPFTNIVKWLISVDLNQNNSFELEELIYSGITDAPPVANFNIPFTATNGEVLVRIQMSNDTSAILDPCEDLIDGEVEDYLIHVSTTPKLEGANENQLNVLISPNPPDAQTFIHLSGDENLEDIFIRILDTRGIVFATHTQSGIAEKYQSVLIDVAALPVGMYTVEISSAVGNASSKLMVVR